jgi:hypothetical protein
VRAPRGLIRCLRRAMLQLTVCHSEERSAEESASWAERMKKSKTDASFLQYANTQIRSA